MLAPNTLAPVTNKRTILITAAIRVVVATVCTVVGIVGVAYLANLVGFSKGLIITLSVTAGVCGFTFGVYWTMIYLVRSGYAKNK